MSTFIRTRRVSVARYDAPIISGPNGGNIAITYNGIAVDHWHVEAFAANEWSGTIDTFDGALRNYTFTESGRYRIYGGGDDASPLTPYSADIIINL
jgi:hypothetical protein